METSAEIAGPSVVSTAAAGGQRSNVFLMRREIAPDTLEIKIMEIAQRTEFETAQRKVRSYDAAILLGYTAFGIVLLAGIYWGSVSSGIAPGDLASMTVFP
jgi:hypothetical protein